jgi:hypothetical protein
VFFYKDVGIERTLWNDKSDIQFFRLRQSLHNLQYLQLSFPVDVYF